MWSFNASVRAQITNLFISGTNTSTIIYFPFFTQHLSWVCSLENRMWLFPHLHHFLDAFLKKRSAQQFWKSEVKCWLQSILFFYSTSTFFSTVNGNSSWSCPLEIERGFFPHFHHFLDAFLKKRTARQFWRNLFTLPPLFSRGLMDTSFLGVPSRDHTWLFPTFALLFKGVLEETHRAKVLEVRSEMLIAGHIILRLW